jgi:hypothetical protein
MEASYRIYLLGQLALSDLFELLAVCQTYLDDFDQFSKEVRYDEAIKIDQMLKRCLYDGLVDVDLDSITDNSTFDYCDKSRKLEFFTG